MKRTTLLSLAASTLLLCACRGHRHNYSPRPADLDPPAPGSNPYDDPVDEHADHDLDGEHSHEGDQNLDGAHSHDGDHDLDGDHSHENDNNQSR